MKKRKKIILGCLFIILVILLLLVPSDDDYYKWLKQNYNIKKSDRLYYYTQDGIELFASSLHKKSFGIITARRQNFEYTDGKKPLGSTSTTKAFRELDSAEGFTIRTLGFSKKFISMEKENSLWKFLMK